MKIEKYRSINFIIIISSLYSLYVFQLVAPSYKYYFANLHNNKTIFKQYQSEFQQIIKYELKDTKIFQLYSNNTFIVSCYSDTNPFQIMFFDEKNNNSFLSNQSLIDFSHEDWIGYQMHFLVNESKIITFDLYQQYIMGAIDLNVSDIQQIYQNTIFRNTNQTFYIINPGQSDNQTAIIHRILRQENIQENITTIYPEQTVTNIQGDQIRAALCKKYFQITEYLVLWNSSSYVEIYQCDYQACSLNAVIQNDINFDNYTYNSSNSSNFTFNQAYNDDWVTNKIRFGGTCAVIYLEYDHFKPVQVYSMSGTLKQSYQVSQAIYDVGALGGSTYQSTILFQNGSLVIFSTTNGSYMYQYDTLISSNYFSGFRTSKRRIVFNFQSRIQLYRLQCWPMVYFQGWRGQCYNCSITCTACNEWNGVCTSCILDYVIEPVYKKSCILPPVINSTYLDNSTTPYPPYTPNDTNAVSNNTEIEETDNLSAKQSQNANQTYPYGAKYEYELKIAQSALDGFQFLGLLLQKIFIVLQLFPFAWIFLSFMNFWNMCSFYAFLHADIPQYLYLLLKLIYDKINVSLLSLDANAQLMYPLPEKLNGLNEQFGVSSNFMVMNLQGIISFFFSLFLILLMAFIINNTFKDSWVYVRFHKLVEIQQVITNQFISGASNYFLPFSLVMYQLNHLQWLDISNLAFHLTFIGVSFCFPFLIFTKTTKFSKPLVTKRLNDIYKIKQQRELFQKIQWIYLSNCNTIIPFLCVLGYPNIFFIFGLPFYLLGVWLAYHSQNFKLNETILAMHRLLFHFFFVFVSLFGSISPFIKHNFTLVCVFILFFGAVHQLATLLFSIVYFIYRQIKEGCSKIADKEAVISQHEINPICRDKILTKQFKLIKFNIEIKQAQCFVQNIADIKKKIKFRKKIKAKPAQHQQKINLNLDNQFIESKIQQLSFQNKALSEFDLNKSVKSHEIMTEKSQQNRINQMKEKDKILLNKKKSHKKIKVHKRKTNFIKQINFNQNLEVFSQNIKTQ